MSSCEGHCGTDLSPDMRETGAPLGVEREHTVERCRAIRAMREAGLRAVPGAEVEVHERNDMPALMVWVWHGQRENLTTLQVLFGVAHPAVGCTVDLAYALSLPPDVLGTAVEDYVRRALERPDLCTPMDSSRSHRIARDPYARRDP